MQGEGDRGGEGAAQLDGVIVQMNGNAALRAVAVGSVWNSGRVEGAVRMYCLAGWLLHPQPNDGGCDFLVGLL